MFKHNDLVTNKKDLYLKWEDSLECGVYTEFNLNDVKNQTNYYFPYDLIYLLDENFKDNSFVLTSYIKKQTIIGRVVHLFYNQQDEPVDVKLVLLLPIRNLYIELPISILKIWNYEQNNLSLC